jgi:tetratricopeptide (TPR) repeat protein
MESLYDLLGAREDDDVDALKRAFRTAVKAHHPDLHPGDPDAPERFRRVIAAHTVLRDAKQRATYDRLLHLERQQFQLKLECNQLRSKLARQQRRLKRMRATAAVAAVAVLIGGYGLFSPLSTTTAIVAIRKDDPAAAAVATAKKNRQTATAVAAADRNEDTPAATAAPKADAVRGNVGGNVDNAGKPVETTGAQVMLPASALEQGEPHEKRDVPQGASKLSADEHADAELYNGASKPSADKPDDTEVANGASKPSDDAGAINGGDAQVIAAHDPAPDSPANDANFYRERGIAAYRSGDFLGAIGNFNEAIRLNPNDAQSYNIRGDVWDELGISQRALADYDEAIRIDPNNPAVFHDRAVLWQRKGALDKAIVDLDRAIRFSFADANLYCDRGLVWYQKGRHDRAIADFDRAIKLDPNFAAAYINRGLILHRNREFNIAFADSKAIRVDPGVFDVSQRMNSRH